MRLFSTGVLVAFLAGLAPTAFADTLELVKQRGILRCGVNADLPGFAARDEAGRWSGFDVDFCRAVAAAVLGDATKVEFVPAPTAERLDQLARGEFDLLARNTTWTLSRDTRPGVRFVGVSYYDGQGFLAPITKGFRSALELDGVSVCVRPDTTSALNLRDYFATHRMRLRLVEVQDIQDALLKYRDGQCDVLTSDMSQLFGLRTRLEEPDQHEILPELISKEPLTLAVQDRDMAWFDVVRWTLFALIEAEEMTLDSRNVARIRAQAGRPEIKRLLGTEGDLGSGLGLQADWAFQVIRQVGNYHEVFERNLGQASPLKMSRGINALWLDGGLLFSPPVR